MSNQMFLKLDGVQGEATHSRHAHEIDILGWSWGLVHATPTATASDVARVATEAITVQKFVDIASPALMRLAAERRRIASGVVTTRHASGGDFLLLKMTDVLVDSVRVSASSTTNQIAETVTLTFTRIEFDYRPTLANGGLGPTNSFRWDLPTNASFQPDLKRLRPGIHAGIGAHRMRPAETKVSAGLVLLASRRCGGNRAAGRTSCRPRWSTT